MGVRLSSSEALVARAIEELDKKFQHTASGWRDNVRTEFEAEYIEDMRRSARQAQHAMRNVEELLRQAIRECSDTGM